MLAISLFVAMAVQPESIVTPVIAKYGFAVQRSQNGLTTYEKWESVIPTLTNAGGQGGQSTAAGASEKTPTLPKEIREIQFLECMSRLSSPPVWQPLRNRYHLKNAYLGSANGVHVYANAAVWELVYVQKQLKLEGGEDWRKLAAEGILADDQTSSRSCIYLFKDADDDAVRAIAAALVSKPDKAWDLYLAMGQIQTRLATAKLVEGYASPNKEIHRAAMYALVYEPLREEAKAQYLEMLDNRLYVASIAKAAARYGWTEALPSIRAYIKEPIGGPFTDVLEAERSLSGKPVPDSVMLALQAICNTREPEYTRAIHTLIRHPDHELVIAHALRITGGKVTDAMPQVQAAKKILQALPKSEVDELRARLDHPSKS
jgi:hypothetical protein